ncbi:hypothetical protein SAMN05421823_102721 [Catalinimonas alkaloidigena]|uniref:Uncharacterized protein n=1 Tax=Catalinimonas alkaloidigena TaxID=1075417 RepID=A0A1G9BWF7_9BACT|nr:hypothetical protein [Catalinimonas alkaloidigena]SDK43295.1 hypothetical protein SAMN05421823_102721 [Catalinimonas alkaloidigena]
MLTVVDYKPCKNKDGKKFFILKLEGHIEMVKSKQSGRYYATRIKTTMACTFNEKSCKEMLGKEIPGRIIKEQVEPYTYVIPDTKREITLDFRYSYQPSYLPAGGSLIAMQRELLKLNYNN